MKNSYEELLMCYDIVLIAVSCLFLYSANSVLRMAGAVMYIIGLSLAGVRIYSREDFIRLSKIMLTPPA